MTALARRLAGGDPERLIWGTDWPHVMNKKPMPNDGDLADLVADWLPDAALRERVLVTNPALLYRFADDESLSESYAAGIRSDGRVGDPGATDGHGGKCLHQRPPAVCSRPADGGAT